MIWGTIAVTVGMAVVSAGVRYWTARSAAKDAQDPKVSRRDLDVTSLPHVSESEAIPVVIGTVKVDRPNCVYYNILDPAPLHVDGQYVGDKNNLTYIHLIFAHPVDRIISSTGTGTDTGHDFQASGHDWLFGNGTFTTYPEMHGLWLSGHHGAGIGPYSNAFSVGEPSGLAAQVSYQEMFGLSGHLASGPGASLHEISVVARSIPDPFNVADKTVLAINEQADGTAEANPAYAIAEILTNQTWGCGRPLGSLDQTSFDQVAQTLKNEGLGVSLIIDGNQSARTVITDVLDHIGGLMYVDPSGIWKIKLLRADYDATLKPLIDDSARVGTPTMARPGRDELPTRVIVEYSTRGEDGRRRTTEATNNFAARKRGLIDVDRSYPMIYSPDAAASAAARDAQALTLPLAMINDKVHHDTGKGLRPGDIIRWSASEYNITEMVVRITEVERGTLADGVVAFKGVEDAFSWGAVELPPGEGTDWSDPLNTPSAATPRLPLELPVHLAVFGRTAPGQPVAPAGIDFSWTKGYCGLIAGRPTSDAIDYALHVDGSARDPDSPFSTAVALDAAMAQGVSSTLSWSDDKQIEADGQPIFHVNGELVIGQAGTVDNTNKNVTVDRGWGDTVPRRASHAVGDIAYLVGYWHAATGSATPAADVFAGVNNIPQPDGATVAMKALTRTPLGQLTPANAPTDSLVMAHRTIRPLAPHHLGIDDNSAPDLSGSVDLTWLHRSRLDADVYHEADTTGGTLESGATYTIRIYGRAADASEGLYRTVTGLTGTSYTYPNEMEATDSPDGGLSPWLRFEIEATRDGYTSWQYQDRRIDR